MALLEFIPIQWVNGSAPAINAVNLVHSGNGIKNVTDAVIELEITVENLMPLGVITLFSGAVIPDGWALCDGTQGTPDLVDKFIMGGEPGTVGVTGGYKDAVNISHNHSASFSGNALAPHTHAIAVHSTSGEITSGSPRASGGPHVGNWSTDSKSAGTPSGSVTVNSSGVSGTNRNLPPYYKLSYIMKIA